MGQVDKTKKKQNGNCVRLRVDQAQIEGWVTMALGGGSGGAQSGPSHGASESRTME